MWLILAAASAVTLGAYEVAKKLALENNAVIPVLFLNVAIGVAVFLPFNLLSAYTELLDGTAVYVPQINFTAHAAIVLKAFLVLSSWVFAYYAMKHLPIIITTAIKSTQPAFILVGAILVFAERLNGYQWAGMIVSIMALMLFSFAGKKEGIVFGKNKWIWCILGATILGAVSSLWDKHLVISYDKIAVQVYTAYYQLLLMIPLLLLLWYPRRKNSTPFKWRRSILWVTLFLTVSDFLYFYSLSLDGALVSVVSTIRKAGVVVPFFAGIILFREKHITTKAILLGFVLLGMFLLYLGS
ncbi:MAG: DMT family transporter [Rikenellaceae bacterium]|nr:DMT family transporter [Rikenellaceae bacterium]